MSGSTPRSSVIWAICSVCTVALCIMESSPTNDEIPVTMTAVSMIHSRNWVSATQATPMILPNISSVALTEETSTSTTLLAFSSMTLCITIPENIATKKYMIIERTSDMIIYTSDDVIFSSPSSPSVYVITVELNLTSCMICLRSPIS